MGKRGWGRKESGNVCVCADGCVDSTLTMDKLVAGVQWLKERLEERNANVSQAFEMHSTVWETVGKSIDLFPEVSRKKEQAKQTGGVKTWQSGQLKNGRASKLSNGNGWEWERKRGKPRMTKEWDYLSAETCGLGSDQVFGGPMDHIQRIRLDYYRSQIIHGRWSEERG
eukprot:TRINITY_DN4382_c0_g1_i1.p3 TRINITY_DN4382_c0_g1~~TRINITY_DN4382_c0_g1_i1.p3  ORF type:complete len:169 (+),score=31.91 TRINITY_DN4382_c0_g1_i1:169-675(+)